MDNLLPGEKLLEGDCPYKKIYKYTSSISKNVELRYKRWLKSRVTLIPHEILLSGQATYENANGIWKPQNSRVTNDPSEEPQSQHSIPNEKTNKPKAKVSKPRKKRQKLTLPPPKYKKKAPKKIATPKKQLNGISHDEDKSEGQDISENKAEDKTVPKNLNTGNDLIFRKPTSLLKKKGKKENQSKPQKNSKINECESNNDETEEKDEIDQITLKKRKFSVDEELNIQPKPSTTTSRRRTLYSPKSFELSGDMSRIFSSYVS